VVPMNEPAAPRQLVLVGGGHSHALALRRLAKTAPPDLRITLISPDPLAAYSGMLPGLVAGHYDVAESHVNLPRLCRARGARFLAARVTALRPDARQLVLDNGDTLNYHLLSLDVGATPDLQTVPGAADHAVPVKPVSDFRRRWQDLRATLEDHRGPLAVTVVGGGAGGTEMVLAVARALRRRGRSATFNLVTSAQLLPGAAKGVRRRMAQRLAADGVTVLEHQPVRRVDAGSVETDAGPLRHDFLLWCTGARAPAWLAASGLPCDENGFLRVEATLRSPADARVFAAGDCAAFPGGLPKAGVYAVRQAPILARNLVATARQRPLKPYRPQRRFLSLLSAGDRDAVGSRGPWPTLSGPWVWRWKDHLDRAFMARLDASDEPPGSP